jgi:hypothetical protein
MRLRSTFESVSHHEVTYLALLECLLAFAAQVLIATHFGTYTFFAAALLLTPLSLLRTRTSAAGRF